MTANLYTELAWLPRAPDDFGARCKTLQAASTSDPVGRQLRALASFALDENQLNRLGRVAMVRGRAEGALAPLTPMRLGIISNATTDFLVPPLVATALRHGLALECYQAPYGQVMQAALAADSPLARYRPDAVLVALDYHGLPLSSPVGDRVAAEQACEASLKQLEVIRTGVHRHCAAPCILQTLARPPEAQFGSFDLVLAGTERNLVESFNRELARSIAGTEDFLLDVASLAETVGLANWHDPVLWNLGKIPFANEYLPIFADFASRVLAAIRGQSRRCLILDLDNTVWGGVIGDDGLEGILVGQGDATGEAFLEVQRSALKLRGRGIVLAVSSKNQDENARLPFQKHPEMLLRENHIAVFQANWSDKASNIRAIAEELSLGLESMVFLDDNPAERGLVRELLPEVAVPELPPDPALYARTLLASGYFESIVFSSEDRERASFYQDNARRLALQRDAGDVDAYLRSLQMQIEFSAFNPIGRSRIAQLINKSNQFNLTTHRYTEHDVAQMERDPKYFTLQARLSDTFGDNGMISVIICRRNRDFWEIDSWLMSCRVLGRGVEQAVLNQLVNAARSDNATRLLGTYIPTERNRLVEDHYSKLGFDLIETRTDGSTIWALPLSTYIPAELAMVVNVAL